MSATSNKSLPRPIYFDAENVAQHYAKTTDQKQSSEIWSFCTAGILISIKYFLTKGHKVVAVIQQSRANGNEMAKPDQFVMKKIMDPLNPDSLFNIGLVMRGGCLVSKALEHGGRILSCDGFQPKTCKSKALKKSKIDQQTVPFTFDAAKEVHILSDKTLDCNCAHTEYDMVKAQQLSDLEINRAVKEIDHLLEYFKPQAAGVSRSRTVSDGADQPKKVRCRFYPECKKESCPFLHPTAMCEFFLRDQKCPYGGDRCWFYHPMCFYYFYCTKEGCQNVHHPRTRMGSLGPQRSVSVEQDRSQVLCRFGAQCRYGPANCPYKHV